MYTNQSATPEHTRAPELMCCHTPGDGVEETCAYLRALQRLRAWTTRAEEAQRAKATERKAINELWLLVAEVSTAHDQCPDHQALVAARTANWRLTQ